MGVSTSTTPAWLQERARLKKLEFTKAAIAGWAKTALAASARVASDGLWCIEAVTDCGWLLFVET